MKRGGGGGGGRERKIIKQLWWIKNNSLYNMYSQQLGAQANNMGTLDEISLYICISLYAYIVLC